MSDNLQLSQGGNLAFTSGALAAGTNDNVTVLLLRQK